jgi:hypothetical protein
MANANTIHLKFRGLGRQIIEVSGPQTQFSDSLTAGTYLSKAKGVREGLHCALIIMYPESPS